MRIVFTFLIFCTILFSQTINEQIRALQDISPRKRVEMMNNIKKQLIQMNQKQRNKTISDLRKKLQTTQGNHIRSNPIEINREHNLDSINIQNQMRHNHQPSFQHNHNGGK